MASYLSRLVKRYGLTDNPYAAAYILPDGTMLDFSEGSGHVRSLDHRHVTWLLPAGWRERWGNSTQAMVHVILKTGMIRWMPECWGVEIHRKPTPAQLRTVKELADMAGLRLDTYKKHRSFAMSYRAGDSRGVLSDLRGFWGS